MNIRDLKLSNNFIFWCPACQRSCLYREAGGDVNNQVVCEDCYSLYKRKPEVVIEALRKEMK